MTKCSEKTSARVARVAGKVLAIRSPVNFCVYKDEHYRIMWGDVVALAASVLTQAADKPKRKPKPKFIARKIALRHKRDAKGWTA